jgi:hypothetical protein
VLQITDPRTYAGGVPAEAPGLLVDATQWRQQLPAMLERGENAAITRALAATTSQPAYANLWRAVCDAANHAGLDGGAPAVVARVFALPLVIVTGSRRPAGMPGVVPDIAAVTALFRQHGALGPTRNFGIGNALCSLETLEGVLPGEIYAWTRDAGATRRELPPAAIAIDGPGETVHLRFLVGAAITPAAEPSFVETASNIGVWGMPLTRALAAQLAQKDVEVLPLARPPLDLLRAAHAGRYAQLDAAFNLFVSNEVRRLRGSTGDPRVVISAHDDNDIRISMSSPFDVTPAAGFRWPLHPLDELAEVAGSVSGLLAACRVHDVECVAEILPARNAQGQLWYPRPGSSGKSVPGAPRH